MGVHTEQTGTGQVGREGQRAPARPHCVRRLTSAIVTLVGMTAGASAALVGAGPAHATSSGTVVAWGHDSCGQSTVPPELSGVTAVAAGGCHSLAVRSDGTVVAWGDNSSGQSSVPEGLSGVTAVAAGDNHSLALTSDGTVVAWGNNFYGQSRVPDGLSGVTAVAAGDYHSLALTSAGTVVAWGDNFYGQSWVPGGLSGVTAVAAGDYYSLAVTSDGTVVAWGIDFERQSSVPPGLSGVIAVAAGTYHSLARKSDGTVVAWGAGFYGQGTVPPGLSAVSAVAAGLSHSVALKSDGTVVAWGADFYGQSTVPPGLSDVSAVAAGRFHSLAVVGRADATPPRIAPTISGTQGADGWYVSDVTVSWNVTDAESAPLVDSGCGTTAYTSDATGLTSSCTAHSAGGSASDSVTVRIDKTAPANIAFVGGIVDGASFALGSVPPSPTCTASDSTSGLAHCSVSGYSKEVGQHTLIATATDNAGNVATATISYRVLALRISGFHSPVNMDTATNRVVNTVKGGSTVPLKFEVFAGSAELTNTSVVTPVQVRRVDCVSGAPIEPPTGAEASGGTVLRYDSAAGQFVYNWKTPSLSNACVDVSVVTTDGSMVSAHFRLK